jgi:hypothetical protein
VPVCKAACGKILSQFSTKQGPGSSRRTLCCRSTSSHHRLVGCDLGPVDGAAGIAASQYSAAMIDMRRRGELAGGVALGVVALISIGFWIGRANPGSTAHPDVLHGTVLLVPGARDKVVVDLDAQAGTKDYGLGPMPWTSGVPGGPVTVGNGIPPCVAVGRHITFGVVHVPVSGNTTDEIVWIDCGGDIGG